MSSVKIRTMTLADLPLAMRLRDQAGWNQTQADLRRFLALSPHGCFVASIAGSGVGTVATFTFGPVAWIAMVLVDEAHRGQGIGKALMRHALDWLDAHGVLSIRLDATPLGQPLYATLGFEVEFELDRYAGTVTAGEPREPVEPLHVKNADQILAIDRSITGTDRRHLLQALMVEHPHEFRTARRQGKIVGYCTSRPGRLATMIGPGLAIDESGADLLVDALGRHAGHAAFVDVPRLNIEAVAIVDSSGLEPQRPLVRMCRGPSVGERPECLWASSGPEKG